MKTLETVLKEMKTVNTGIKQDVINYLLENNNNDYDLQMNLEDIVNYGCNNGEVNHLIYYVDIMAYFKNHETEILGNLELNERDVNISDLTKISNLVWIAFEDKAHELYDDLKEINMIGEF